METNNQSVDRSREVHLKPRMIAVLCVLFLFSVLVLAETTDEGGVLRSRVYKLNHISSQQAQESLELLSIGKSYNPLTGEILILTSNSGTDLLRATEVLQLLDQDPTPAIRTLMTGSEDEPLPDLETFTADLGAVTAGTLTDAPQRDSENPAIIDIVDGRLIAIASEDVLDTLGASIESWKEQNKPAAPEPEAAIETPSEQVAANDLSGELLTAQPAPEATEAMAEPNLPGLAPEPNESPVEPDPEPMEASPVTENALAVVEPNESLAEPAPEATEVLAEPNLPGLAPEPNESPVEPAPEPMEAATATEPGEGFMSEELLETLAEARAETAEPEQPIETDVSEVPEKAAVVTDTPSETVPDEQPTESAAEEDAESAPADVTEEPEQPIETDIPEVPEKVAAVTDAPSETVPDEQPAEPAAEEDPMKIMLALMEKSKAHEKALAAQQAEEDAESAPAEVTEEPEQPIETDVSEVPKKAAAVTDTPSETVPDEQPAEPAAEEDAESVPAEVTEEPEDVQPALSQDDSDALKAELTELRQKIAALEAKTAPDKEPKTKVPAASEELSTEPAADSKIQRSGIVQTAPQLDPELSEKELDTVIDLPQEVELESLVDLVGKQLGLNYLYDPAILKNQKVKLKVHGGKIKVRETYTLLESVLRQKGFVMTRRGRFITIFKTADFNQIAKFGDIVIREPGEPIPPGTLIVSTKFKLDHISTASAQTMLTQLQLGMTNGYKEIAETNTLIVTDYTYRMDQIQQVLDMIDLPGEKKEYQFRTLKYMAPSEIVPKLQELAKQLEGVSLQISTPAAAEAPKTRTVTTRDPKTGRTTTKEVPIRTAAPTPAKNQPAQPDAVYIDTDDRTNRILMAGKADQITLVNELIDALDVPQHDLKFVREYVIQNIEATEVIDVLNELSLVSVSVSTTSKAPTPATSPAASRSRTPTPAARTPKPSSSAGAPNQPDISIRPATNSLLVNATAEQHKAIELVIAHIDIVQKDQRTIRQYEIQYVDTQEIIDTMVDLQIIAPQTTSTSTRGTGSRSSRPTSTRSASPANPGAEAAAPISLPTTEGGSEKDITAEQPQISVLETTNSLLVYATPRQHEAIALIIAHADRQLDTITTPYVVYNLENQNAPVLAETLNKLIRETFDQADKTSSSDSKVVRSGLSESNIPMLQEESPKVIGDERSNSIIVYANKRNQQWISELVRELDQNRYQVLLDVTLVEISKADEFSYDLDLISAIPDIDPLSGAVSNLGESGELLHSMGSSTVEDILTKLNATEGQDRFKEGVVRSGKFDGFYGNEHVMVLLDLMESKGYGRVLNRPRILVNDNEPGTIDLTEKTYREVRTTTIVGSDNPQTSENVDYRDYSAGITLTITPHISQEDRLRLEIMLNRSDFNIKEGSDPSLPPDTIDSNLDTIVTVPDESTVILGGLERINQSKGGSKVPILGDIPIIGGLFRSIGNSSDQRKIYIFVKANILRPGEDNQDLKNISEKNINVFEYYERQMQGYQDWPGIDSDPIDPPRILREEEDILDKIRRDNADEEILVPMREES